PPLGTPRKPSFLVFVRRCCSHFVRFSVHRAQHRVASRQLGPVPLSCKHCTALCMSIQRVQPCNQHRVIPVRSFDQVLFCARSPFSCRVSLRIREQEQRAM